jgi:predicted RNase H-like HicB family nuclease
VKFKVVIEYDRETNSFLATVPGFPIIVDANSEREAIQWAKKGLRMHFEQTEIHRRLARAGRRHKGKVVTVEL